jgi:excisionase family DNA binding protein
MIEPLQSIESAAKTLSLSPWTVRAYIRQGKIRPVRIGRRVLIESQEIDRIVEEGRANITVPARPRD